MTRLRLRTTPAPQPTAIWWWCAVALWAAFLGGNLIAEWLGPHVVMR